MDTLRFHLVLIAFILIFHQKYAQGIKCFECRNCNQTGVSENSTCVIDRGFCYSISEREKVIDRGSVVGRKDVIRVTRRCLEEDLYILCVAVDSMKSALNMICCRDHDLCNIETPELGPWQPSDYKWLTVSGDKMSTPYILFLCTVIGCVIIVIVTIVATLIAERPVRPSAPPSDQNIDTKPMMGSQSSSLTELYNCSQSGSDSGIFEEYQLPYCDLVPSDLSLEDTRKGLWGQAVAIHSKQKAGYSVSSNDGTADEDMLAQLV